MTAYRHPSITEMRRPRRARASMAAASVASIGIVMAIERNGAASVRVSAARVSGLVVLGVHAASQLAERMLEPLHAHQDCGRGERERDRVAIVADADRDADAGEQPDHGRRGHAFDQTLLGEDDAGAEEA